MITRTKTAFGLFVCLLIAAGCNKKEAVSAHGTALQLTLDWHPEPEFGGFYAARENGSFAQHNLDVSIKSAGEGAPVWQLVATGKTDFGTTAADQVLIARATDADVVALFAVYQTFPQGVMVHKARHFTSLRDVFTHPGTLEAEEDTWLSFSKNKFGVKDLKIIGYGGGIGTFLARQDYSQQCFVTSEPILAAAQQSDPQTFLIADAGYNPYTTVVISRGDLVKNKPALAKAMVAACREGWRAYLDDPSKANAEMSGLNHDMDAATFTAAAAAQKPLIDSPNGMLGVMTAQRWDQLSKQLVDLKVIKAPIPAQNCFVNVDQLP